MIDKFVISTRHKHTVAKIIAYDKKYQTIMLEHLSGSQKGKILPITTSTLKKYWKILD